MDLKETLFLSLIQDQIVFDDYNTARQYYNQSIKENTKCPSLHTIDGYFIPGSANPLIWTSELLSVSANKPKFKIKLLKNEEEECDRLSDEDISVSKESDSERSDSEKDREQNGVGVISEKEPPTRLVDSSPPRDAEVLNVAKIEESPEDDSFLNRRNISNLILISSCFIA